jgi:hypothetical protein
MNTNKIKGICILVLAVILALGVIGGNIKNAFIIIATLLSGHVDSNYVGYATGSFSVIFLLMYLSIRLFRYGKNLLKK